MTAVEEFTLEADLLHRLVMGQEEVAQAVAGLAQAVAGLPAPVVMVQAPESTSEGPAPIDPGVFASAVSQALRAPLAALLESTDRVQAGIKALIEKPAQTPPTILRGGSLSQVGLIDNSGNRAAVENATPGANDFGLVVRQAGGIKLDASLLDSNGILRVDAGQVIDTGNTKVLTATDCQPGSPWVGAASHTRSLGVVGVFLSVISPTVVAGYFTFEFGEDGVSFPISIRLHSNDFSTIRFRPLLNVGEYYRAKFEPDLALGGNVVIVTSQFSRQLDPGFIVPSDHVFEETNAAFDAHFAFVKLFDEVTGLSVNVRPDNAGNMRVSDAIGSTGALTNLALNPSFEEGVAGVTATSQYLTASATFAQSTAKANIGTHSLLVTATDGGGHSPGVAHPLFGTFLAGITYAAEVELQGFAGGEIVAVFLGDEGSGDVSSAAVATVTATGWTKVTLTWTPTANRTQGVLVTRTTTTNRFYVDNIMVVKGGSTPADYFDGDQFGSVWAGTPGASPSITGGSLLPDITGQWDYRAGVSGTPTLPVGARIVGVTAHSTLGGSMTINGGNSVPIPANTAPVLTPNGQLVSPTLVFTGTDSYFVEFVI